MEKLAKKDLPLGFNYSWSGLSLEEIRSGGQSAMLFALGLAAGLPDAVGAIRELHSALHHSCLSVPMAMLGALIAQSRPRPVERRVLPDRTGDADRTGQQERHSDRGVRRAVAAQGPLHSRSRGGSGAHSPASHPDDLVCLHPRRAAAGVRQRRRRRKAATRSALPSSAA